VYQPQRIFDDPAGRRWPRHLAGCSLHTSEPFRLIQEHRDLPSRCRQVVTANRGPYLQQVVRVAGFLSASRARA